MPSTFYQVETKPSGTWQALATGAVTSEHISGATEGGGTIDNGLATGGDASVGFQLPVKRAALGTVPERMPVRVSFTMADDYGRITTRAAVGRVAREEETDTNGVVNLTCEGLKAVVAGTRAYSPLFERMPIALRTTITSPTSINDATVTPLEWQLLNAGGWPFARDAENGNALFYYDLDTSPLAPDYAWFAGEDGWQECLNLVRAVGGQLYQRSDGVIVYRQPLSFGNQTPTWALSDIGTNTNNARLFQQLTRERSHSKVPTEFRCTFTRRRVYSLQTIQEDTEIRTIAAGETRTFPIQTEQPLSSIETTTGLVKVRAGQNLTITPLATAMTVVNGAMMVIQPGAGYTASWQVAAQRVSVSITNTTSGAIHLHKIAIRGEPVGAGGSGSVTVGTPGETLNIDDSAFIQSYAHAEALCNIYKAFYGSARWVYHASGIRYTPQLDTGLAINLNSRRYSLTNLPALIVRRSHAQSGVVDDFDLVDLTGVPKLSEFYQVGTTDYSGQSLRLGW